MLQDQVCQHIHTFVCCDRSSSVHSPLKTCCWLQQPCILTSLQICWRRWSYSMSRFVHTCRRVHVLDWIFASYLYMPNMHTCVLFPPNQFTGGIINERVFDGFIQCPVLIVIDQLYSITFRVQGKLWVKTTLTPYLVHDLVWCVEDLYMQEYNLESVSPNIITFRQSHDHVRYNLEGVSLNIITFKQFHVLS